ncbi:DUF1905 domain-containing protein [Microbacterium lushaniae]|nr:DUF1905 domain-containing protein [Microbacterium lushaniae]KAA9155324.1 DUF1905 domain-containing protein [Microbacterium lushaniae]
MHLRFQTHVYRWQARQDAAWFFADVPEELSAEVREVMQPFAGGFGAVRVQATVGETTWRTSIFPGSSGIYALPLKRAVREGEGLVEGGPVTVDLDILDG